jgi:hypothetical protein
MFGSGSSRPPATVVSVPIASLGFRTDIMLLALGGSSITEHDGLTVVATPRTPDFWWGNFVLAPGASALDAAVALHAEMFPEADVVSVGIDAEAAGHGLMVERSTALSSTAVCLPPHPNTDAEVRRLRPGRNFQPRTTRGAKSSTAAEDPAKHPAEFFLRRLIDGVGSPGDDIVGTHQQRPIRC